MSWGGVNAHVILTTKSWAHGDGGAIWTVPEDGWYFVRVRFTKNESSEDYASDIQLQLKSEKNGLLAYTTITKLTSMTAIDLPTVGRFTKGDKISVNAHVAQAGLKFNTTIFDVKLSSY